MAGTNICCNDGDYYDGSDCETINTTNITGVDSNCNRYLND